MKTVETSWLDRAALAVSPAWGRARLANKLAVAALSSDGYIVPGSPRKEMKGATARAGSPSADIDAKLPGMRAISRDLAMNSPLAVSILRRHRTNVINSGLQVQARIDREYLGVSDDDADKWEEQAERVFDLWNTSTECDFSRVLSFSEIQAQAFFNMLLSGDVWIVNATLESTNDAFPFSTRIQVIDADLVRDPSGVVPGSKYSAGVERDSSGRPVAIHVWDTYPADVMFSGRSGKSTRVQIFDENGRRQVWHIADIERPGQTRGTPLLAPAVSSLKQLTRLADAQLMSALVSSFLTVFVKDASGIGATMSTALTPDETLFGGGQYGPNAAPVSAVADYAANDLEMGHGNITYLDESKDVTIADPRKVDTGFEDFWRALAVQICAAGGASFEQVMVRYDSSYTAARAAMLDVWRGIRVWRALMERRLCAPAYAAVIEEGIIRGMISAPGFFTDPLARRAWLGSYWVGVGQGAIDPLKEAKATQFELANLGVTYEESYNEKRGGRWDSAMRRRAREERLLTSLDLVATQVTENASAPETGSGK